MVGSSRLLMFCSLMIATVLSGPGLAQVHKYQDEQGKWHYTDKPPPGQDSEVVIRDGDAKDKLSHDLAADLLSKYEPRSAVERASLAVVAIKTRLSSGSGFFCSASGHILTNKHVAKPAETKQWQDLEKAVERKRAVYQVAKKEYDTSASRLDELEDELEKYRRMIEQAPDNYSKQVAETEYRYLKHRYDGVSERFEWAQEKFNASRRSFEKARSEFNWQTSAAILERRFKVFLKDDAELSARLISVSAKHDIALLKVDGYKTPFLESQDTAGLFQGMKVFAIGSPLGLRDSVTSGVLTRVREDYLMTDAKLLSGSSGGPLINAEGKVVGINTLKLTETVSADGFGAAIPMAIAKEVFGDRVR